LFSSKALDNVSSMSKTAAAPTHPTNNVSSGRQRPIAEKNDEYLDPISLSRIYFIQHRRERCACGSRLICV
jgi:hypothetical protein